MYHRLLLPVAYEPGIDIDRECAVARVLAAPGAAITLLHVVEKTPFYAIDYMPLGWREGLIEAILADLDRRSAGLPGAQVAVIEGEAGAAIVDRANAEGSDCIVLASHRSNRALIGSTATWVARHAPCAVHLIR